MLLNPSTADAFKLDPTVTRCVRFAQRWGADMLEVVNLFSFRTSSPVMMKNAARKPRADHEWTQGGCDLIGGNAINDAEILAACTGATRVIVAWGNDGNLYDRDQEVTALLINAGIRLEALQIAPRGGVPKHPLARGKHRIPDDIAPVPWRLIDLKVAPNVAPHAEAATG